MTCQKDGERCPLGLAAQKMLARTDLPKNTAALTIVIDLDDIEGHASVAAMDIDLLGAIRVLESRAQHLRKRYAAEKRASS